jgi:hypothetical protein
MFSNAIAKEWKYKWFGFWGLEEKYEGKIYQLKDYIDTTCSLITREMLVNYLKNAPTILVGQVQRQQCALCPELLEGAAFSSDGVWLWTDELSHYVEKHNFCIPNAMVQHILDKNGIPPEKCNVARESLPWP